MPPSLPPGIPAPAARWVGGYGMCSDSGGTTPCTDGSTIALWKDQSGNGYDLTVPASTTGPTYKAAPNYLGLTNGGTYPNLNPFLGRGGAKFDGATTGLYNASFHPCANTTSPITWMVAGLSGGGASNATVGLQNGAMMAANINVSTDQFNTNVPSGGGASYNRNYSLYCGRSLVVAFDPSQSTFANKIGKFHSGGFAYTPTGSSFPNPGTVNAGVYVGRDTAFPHWFNGTLFEVACWNSALTDLQLAQLDAYLGATYFRTGFSHLLTCGDSIMRGYPSNQTDDPAAYGSGSTASIHLKLWKSLSAAGGWSSYDGGAVNYSVGVGVSGCAGSTQNICASFKNYRDPWAKNDVVILEGGTNDIGNGGQTDAQTIASIQTYCGLITAATFPRIILWTIPRRGDWPSGQGPYGGVSGGTWSDAKEAYRVSVNNWIRNNAITGGYCHAVYDPEALGFTNPADGSLYQSDKLHYTDAGYSRHASNLLALIVPATGRRGFFERTSARGSF